GTGVPGVKLYAFGLSAAIAALGGILLAFRSPSITYTDFTNLSSITFVGLAVVGGVGYLFGPVAGAALATGALWGQVFDAISSGTGKYIVLVGGVSVMVLVLLNQNGLVKEWIAQVGFLRSKLRPLLPFLSPASSGPLRERCFSTARRSAGCRRPAARGPESGDRSSRWNCSRTRLCWRTSGRRATRTTCSRTWEIWSTRETCN